MKKRQMIWPVLLAVVITSFLPLVNGFASQIETPSPRPTCTECELAATRADGLSTAWARQADSTPSQVIEQAVVHGILFWMDSCGHCHQVLQEVLPPLQEKYGSQLEITLVELQSAAEVDRLYQTAEAMGIEKQNVAVPFLIVGDHVMIGSKQIPEQLPGLIEDYLAAGGVDYPELEPLADLIPEKDPSGEDLCIPDTPCADDEAKTPISNTPEAVAQTGEGAPPDHPVQKGQLSNGFTLAIVIMAGMILSVGYTGYVYLWGDDPETRKPERDWRNFAIPVLAILGLLVAGYLAYIETQAVQAVCGPVGDCNAVQSSPYAKLFGFLPIGILGVIGYLLILVAWIVGRIKSGRYSDKASLAVFAIAFPGTLFSIYLTYLEPFVIRAVCIWCLSSAVIITLVLLLSIKPALHLLNK